MTQKSTLCDTCLQLPDDAHNSSDSFLDAMTMAMTHGARRIYVMTSLHDVASAIARMASPTMKGIVYSGKTPFKPCSHFVQPLLSSGHASVDCYDSNWQYLYTPGDFPNRSIIGTCRECGQNSSHIPDEYVYCDASTPNVAVKPGTLVRGVFENSLWLYESFWAMFVYGLEQTSSSKRETLKLSYVVQRLLWEIRVSMSFVSSHNLNFRNIATYSNKTKHSSNRGRSLKVKLCRSSGHSIFINEIIRLLYQWKCDAFFYITDCVKSLTRYLLVSKHLTKEQSKLINEFQNRMKKISYQYPMRDNLSQPSINSYLITNAKSIRFWPSAKYRSWIQSPFHSYCSHFNQSNDNETQFSETTKKRFDSNTTVQSEKLSPGFDNIVLVIVFKSSDPRDLQMVKFYDFMYGRHFRHIVYCATGTESMNMFAKMYPQPLNVIDLKITDHKLFSYICVSEAMKVYADLVTGYLHLNSETLFNPWSLADVFADLDKPWINVGTIEAGLYETEVQTADDDLQKTWKDREHGRRALNNSVHDLLFISRTIGKNLIDTNSTSTNEDVVEYLTKYSRSIKRLVGNSNETTLSNFKARLGVSLIYYLPVKDREQFTTLADEFSRYNVHADIVIPTILKTLNSKFIELNGTISQTGHTFSLLSSYSPHNVFLHPWKMHLMTSNRRSQFVCEKYLPRVELSLKHTFNSIEETEFTR